MMCIYYQIIDKVFIASREWKQELWTHRIPYSVEQATIIKQIPAY